MNKLKAKHECIACGETGAYDSSNDMFGSMTIVAEGYIHWGCYNREENHVK